MNYGLSEDIIIEYWKDRSNKQGIRTVGHANSSIESQKIEYQNKQKFISKYINPELKTLDYGCGVGRHSILFNKNKYVGVDITENLLNLAIQLNDGYKYKLIELYGNIQDKFEQIFTSTVLQHCDDKVVSKIIQSFRNVIQKKGILVFYENSQVKADHVNGRSPLEYVNLTNHHFDVINVETSSHIVHGEEHSITKMEVTK